MLSIRGWGSIIKLTKAEVGESAGFSSGWLYCGARNLARMGLGLDEYGSASTAYLIIFSQPDMSCVNLRQIKNVCCSLEGIVVGALGMTRAGWGSRD